MRITVTDENKADVIFQYADTVIDGMDFQQLWDYAYDGIVNNLKNYTNEQLEKEINEFYPEILDTNAASESL